METQPLRYSIQVCALSAGSVSLMNFKASSNKTSPVGESDLHSIFRSSNSHRRAPAFSSSIRPRKDSSISMQPRNPEDKQSFQNDVYPCNNGILKINNITVFCAWKAWKYKYWVNTNTSTDGKQYYLLKHFKVIKTSIINAIMLLLGITKLRSNYTSQKCHIYINNQKVMLLLETQLDPRLAYKFIIPSVQRDIFTTLVYNCYNCTAPASKHLQCYGTKK